MVPPQTIFFAFLREEKRHHFRCVARVCGRAHQQIDRRAFPDAHGGHGGIVAGLAFIQAVALVHDHGRDHLGRERVVVQTLGVFDDILALPAEIHRLAYACIDGAVAHGDEHIMQLQGNAAFQYGFALDDAADDGVIHAFAVPQQDDVGVIELNDLGRGVVGNADDGECGIGHLPNAAHGQSFCNGVHAFLNGHAVCHHRADDLAGERRKDVGLYAAAQTVRQHHCQRFFIVADDFHTVSAKLLIHMVQADVAGVCPKVVHGCLWPSFIFAGRP